MNVELYNLLFGRYYDIVIDEKTEIGQVRYIKNGTLIRRKDGKKFKIRNYIPRFVKDDNYTKSFDYQWKRFRNLQHDSQNGKQFSWERLRDDTEWKREELAGKIVLECGSGPGRFTEHLYNMVESKGLVVAVDMSGAIDVNLENLGLHPNVLYIQDDITNLHYMNKKADYVFCFGVLQHTPNPHRTLHRLSLYMKPDGKISVDVYVKKLMLEPFYGPKYFWRPVTRRMNEDMLVKILQWYIPKYIKFDTYLRTLYVRKLPVGKYILSLIPIPCWNYYIDKGITEEERIQHAIMDTFDALSPRYDRPCSFKEMDRWAKQEQYKMYKIKYGCNGLILNASR